MYVFAGGKTKEACCTKGAKDYGADQLRGRLDFVSTLSYLQVMTQHGREPSAPPPLPGFFAARLLFMNPPLLAAASGFQQSQDTSSVTFVGLRNVCVCVCGCVKEGGGGANVVCNGRSCNAARPSESSDSCKHSTSITFIFL